MRELVIRNLTLIVDARDSNAVLEAEQVIEWANEALDDNDGGPTLYFATDDATATAEYRDNGDDEE